MSSKPSLPEGSGQKRVNILLVGFFVALALLAALIAISYLGNLEISSIVNNEQLSYEQNIMEQSGSLNRVVFAMNELLVHSATERGSDRRALLIELGQGVINHARIPRIIGASFLKPILGEDPLFLAERAAKSNARYVEDLGKMAGLLERTREQGDTSEGRESLAEFIAFAQLFMGELRARSSLLSQIEGAYLAENRRANLRMHSQVSRNLTEFSLITALLVAISIFYLRSRLFLTRELNAHRRHLSELVEARTEELGTANARLSRALGEKEVLIKEVYHRVKNNLAMVASLISLQQSETTVENFDEAFANLSQRLGAISLIHERLYQSADLSNIAFADYVTELSQTLIYSLSANPEAISFELDAPDVKFSADTLIPLGLIITELVTNSLKYAFTDRARGRIRISLRDLDGTYLLEVRDDGTPPPSRETILESASLGARLVAGLVLQLGGTLDVDLEGGTALVIRFPRERAAPAA